MRHPSYTSQIKQSFTEKMNKRLEVVLLLVLASLSLTDCFKDSEKILLSEVRALTLHYGQMTNARRTPAVPQLKCMGGSAQHKFQPKVVQCINQGYDGYDIQWECKTDMDNAYRFGAVEVTCEGYDYPNDPYVLKGSCGLEYTLEFTEEGLQRERSKSYSYSYSYEHKESTGGLGGLLVFVAILLAIYVIYKTCIVADPVTVNYSTGEQPPPYGFRPEYIPHTGSAPPPSYDNCGYTNAGFTATPGAANNEPGFWSGAATGGLLGYLFGRNNAYHPTYRTQSPWYGQNYYYSDRPSHSAGSSFFSGSSSSGGSSSGTRTASGFGGTSRR